MNQDSKNLWIAVAFAIGAAAFLYSYIQEKNREVTKNFGAKITVVVAKKDIYEMQPIGENVLDIVEIPEKYKQPGTIVDPNELIGKVSLANIKAGEQILSTKVIEPSPRTGLSFQVSPGKRAISIPADQMRGVAKLLRPGDKIDILASVSTGKGQNQIREVKTLMQNVPILATGSRIANELPALYSKTEKGVYKFESLNARTDYGTVTIEATPLEAQNLTYILIENPGNLFFTLRHPSDSGPAGVPSSSTAESILGRPRFKPRVPASSPDAKKDRAPVKKKRGGMQPL